jgi:hypothetical protein
VSIIKSGISAIGKLLILVGLAAAFMLGLVGVVYMSLQGHVVKVPDITGKSYGESEKELALLGLKIQRRADRVSEETPNTILEQLPRPGETVKTGQLIFVVASKQGPPGENPSAIKKTGDEDDTEKIEEMISDKPKKAKANTNSNKKKADTTRDVIGNTSNSNSNSNSTEPGSNKEPGSNSNSGDKGNKNSSTDKPANKSVTIKPAGGETRPRTSGKPQ